MTISTSLRGLISLTVLFSSCAAQNLVSTPDRGSPGGPAQSTAAVLSRGEEPTTPGAEDQPPVFRKRVEEVYVVFTVTNKHGRPIRTLTKDQIRVLDDHKPPQDVISFSSETDLPLRLGLLVDASSSVRDRFDLEQQAAMSFLAQVIRPGSDLAFVEGFDTAARLTQDFTGNTAFLARGIRRLRAAGGTAMYDAIYNACRDKLMSASSHGPVRRAIIVLSDGEDNQSRVSVADTIAMAQRAEVIIYAISTNYSNIKMRGDAVLAQLAEATGGRAFFPLKMKDVLGAFTQIRDELRSQYALAYKPAELKDDGRYHSIEIMAENKNYHVRARSGYYAPTR